MAGRRLEDDEEEDQAQETRIDVEVPKIKTDLGKALKKKSEIIQKNLLSDFDFLENSGMEILKIRKGSNDEFLLLRKKIHMYKLVGQERKKITV